MNEGAMVVSIVAIACATSLGMAVINTIKAAIAGRGKRVDAELLTEIRELRTEVRQLRQQNNDLMLAVDNALDRRVAHLEPRMHAAPRPAETEQQLIHRG